MPKEPPRRRLIAMEGIEERREDGGGARKLVLAEDVRDEHKRGRANRRHFLPHRGLLESQSKPPAPSTAETDAARTDGPDDRRRTFFWPAYFLPSSDVRYGRRTKSNKLIMDVHTSRR